MLGFLLSPVLQIEDIDGKPLVGGKVFVYEANTSNLATVYKDYNGTFNTNPVILDTAGHNTIIAEDDKLYDITVKDTNDNLLFSVEDVAVGGEGGIAPTGNVVVRAGNNGITVTTSVENDTTVYTVSIDYNFVASKTDLNSKQDVLSAGSNISIENDTISVTGLKTINVSEPLQKTDTVSSWNLSIDTDGLQTTLSAGTNIDAEKLASGYIDLKNDGCYASINSIAIGSNTIAYGTNSFAGGFNTVASGYNQTVLGKYNIPNETDLFQIGAGLPGNNKNALTVDNNGDVNVNTTTGLKNTRTFFDNIGETTYYYTRFVPIHPCSGSDFIPLTNGGDTGIYGVCSQSFNVPSGKKVKVDGFYQIKGGLGADGRVSNWNVEPICETWIIDDSTGSATEINQAAVTNGGNLPRSVPIPFSFVTSGDFKLGFCTEGTWGGDNFTNISGQTNPTAGNLLISYTTTIIDKE